MKEITRIHIAKVAYDIEVAAKKQLEKYIQSLEAYTPDADVLVDIEIRITELLEERGVKAGGVIGSDDVAAVREQLGEPYEFAEEDGDIAVGSVGEGSGRTFFRSTDDAVLGGVLGGVAAYFSVNPLWPRLLFILLTAISFGTALLAYILLWIVVPPARTATEKLRQAGQPVTLDSIRELNAASETTPENRVAPTVKRFFSVAFGIASLLGAILTLALTVFCIIGALGVGVEDIGERIGLLSLDGDLTVIAWLVYALVVAGLALLAALFSLAAYAFFMQKVTKRMLISGIVIIALGLTSFAATIGVVATQSWQVSTEAQNFVKTTNVELSEEFEGVRSIEIETNVPVDESGAFVHYPSIEYVVDEGKPRYELSALPGATPSITIDGETAKISLKTPTDYRNRFVQTSLVVYGPAITSLTNNSPNAIYTAASQPELDVTSQAQSRLNIKGGQIESVVLRGSGSIDAGSVSVTSLIVNAIDRLVISAGTVRDLDVTQPNVCPSNAGANSTVTVSGVISETMIYNGQKRDAQTYRANCAEVIIGNEYNYRY